MINGNKIVYLYPFPNLWCRLYQLHWWLITLTHWGRVTHICVSELNIIGSDNGLSPGRCQAIIWNNAGLLLIEPLGTNFIEISIGIQTFSFKKMRLNMSSAKWRPFCLGLNVLKPEHNGWHFADESFETCIFHEWKWPIKNYKFPWSLILRVE